MISNEVECPIYFSSNKCRIILSPAAYLPSVYRGLYHSVFISYNTKFIYIYIFAITFSCHAIIFKTIRSLITGLWFAILFCNSYVQVSKSEYEAIIAD